MFMEKNLTSGSVLKIAVNFSLPFFLSYFLQTLYGMADLFIIGRFNGVEGTTAVAIGSQMMHMVTVMTVGLAMGSTVTIARAAGADDGERLSRAAGNTVTIFMSLSLAAAAALFFLAPKIAALMSTPREAVKETVAYLSICFAGIPAIVAYNIISAMLRGMGDSKSPALFVAVACAVNVALDFVFIGALKMGAAGAALGTTLSQCASVAFALLFIRRESKRSRLLIRARDLRVDKKTAKEILKIGLPVSLQDGFIQISFLVITVIANARGLTDAAAVGIVEKIIGLMFLVPSSMLSTVSALAAQNFGAGKTERARSTLMICASIAFSVGIVFSIAMQFCAARTVSLFTASAEVAARGGEYLRSYVWDCALAGIHFCFSGYFCALSLSSVSFAHNAASIIFARIPLAYIASKKFPGTLFPMGLAPPAGSLLSSLICAAVYLWERKSYKREKR